MDESSKRPRRKRYPGPNPRSFDEKYKEHRPDQFPETIAHIIDRGGTPAGMHRPIMVAEVLDALALHPGDVVADCTLGFGGHAKELHAAVLPGGRLLGFDTDARELTKTEERLRSGGAVPESLWFRHLNFAGIANVLAVEQPDGVDGLLADLGVSSMQLDDPLRGFGFKVDGPLDMRMNPDRGMTASQLLSSLDVAQLSRMLDHHADEPNAGAVAQSILKAHAKSPLLTTFALVEVIRARSRHPNEDQTDQIIRRVFQALRIGVNDEFGSLDAFLRQLPRCLKPGGRAVLLSFHSGEDRRIKNAFKLGLQRGDYGSISQEVTRPSMEEQRSNPRSRSAKLRWVIRSSN